MAPEVSTGLLGSRSREEDFLSMENLGRAGSLDSSQEISLRMEMSRSVRPTRLWDSMEDTICSSSSKDFSRDWCWVREGPI